MFTHEKNKEKNTIKIKRLGATIALVHYHSDDDSNPIAEVFYKDVDQFTKGDIDSYIKSEKLKLEFHK